MSRSMIYDKTEVPMMIRDAEREDNREGILNNNRLLLLFDTAARTVEGGDQVTRTRKRDEATVTINCKASTPRSARYPRC